MSNPNPKAIRKAMDAAELLAKAARLLREAAEVSEETIGSGRYDFIHWATEIEAILSTDDGEAGIGPALSRWIGTKQ